MKMAHHGHMNRHYPPPFMSGIGGSGGGGGHPSGGRRRPDRNKGPSEEVAVCREKSSSNSASIDVIPEDQFHGNCMPTEVNVTSTNNSGSAVPSEEGSHYTKRGRFRFLRFLFIVVNVIVTSQKRLVPMILKILAIRCMSTAALTTR